MSQPEVNVQDLYLESYTFTTAAAIVGSVDHKICVILRDGRNLLGVLRTFDQFANLVIQDTFERIYLANNRYAEAERGVYLVRGENVVMMGEVDPITEDLLILEMHKVLFADAEKEWKDLRSLNIRQEKEKSKRLLARGLVSESIDMY